MDSLVRYLVSFFILLPLITFSQLSLRSGKRIELAPVGDSLSNFLESQASQEVVVHFKIHPDDIAMLTKDRVTGIHIIGKTGSYNYELHEKARATFNAQLDLLKKMVTKNR